MKVLSKKAVATIATAIGVVTATAVLAASVGAQDEPVRSGPPAIADELAPSMAKQLGVGERLLLVVGGTFPTEEEAQLGAAGLVFGEVQGFYVAPIDQFSGLREALGGSDDGWALVSAFRTEEGALGFFDLAVAAGATPLITPRVESLPGVYAGLGQEPEPSGDGPLLHQVPASAPEVAE